MCHKYRAYEPQLPKPVLLEPILHNKRSDEKPVHCNKRVAPLTTTRESSHSNKDPVQPKINIKKKRKVVCPVALPQASHPFSSSAALNKVSRWSAPAPPLADISKSQGASVCPGVRLGVRVACWGAKSTAGPDVGVHLSVCLHAPVCVHFVSCVSSMQKPCLSHHGLWGSRGWQSQLRRPPAC